MLHPRSADLLLKAGFGQHILNGATVGLLVGLVEIGLSSLFGFQNGMAAGTGAICVSIADMPNPLGNKLKILPFAWALAVISALLTALTFNFPEVRGVVVVLVSGCAGLMVGYGRWALPVSVLSTLALVFTLGAPVENEMQALRYVAMFATGGFTYLCMALLATKLTDISGRRIAIAECFREFAHYLRAVAGFYDPAREIAEVYRHVVEQQAMLSDHLRSARQQVYVGSHDGLATRFSAALLVQLDALDALVSAHADYKPLRAGETGAELRQLVAELAHALADDLDHLSGALLRYRPRLTLQDRQALLDKIGEEVNRLKEQGNLSARALRAARATRTKFAWVAEHLALLPKALHSDEAAKKMVRDIDLAAFTQPLSLSPRAVLDGLGYHSVVTRHAVRFGLAMGFGYLLIALVPSFNHGNWILLTIAVVLRAQYGATRQRRNERLLGNILGCLAAALALRVLPTNAQLLLIPLSIGIAHAYLRVNYLITSIAACINSILSLHFLDPVDAPPIFDRLLDTFIGVVIALIFARLLPRWEYQDAPRMVGGLMDSFARYTRQGLVRLLDDHTYRMARRDLLEALASVTESATRARGEPIHAQAAMPPLGDLLSAAYGLAAQMVGIRVLLQRRGDEINPEFADRLLARSRETVLEQLDLAQDLIDQPCLTEQDETLMDAEKALQLRCAELCTAGAQLHRIAALYRKII